MARPIQLTKPTPIELRDMLVSDAVAGTAAAGQVPDRQAASEFIVEVLQGMDRKKVLTKDPTPGLSRGDGEELIAEEYERRTGRKAPKVERDLVEPTRIITQEQLHSGLMGRIVERFRLIKSHPELYLRVKRLVLGLNHRAKSRRLKAAHELYAMLDETDKIVGHSWRKPPSKKIMLT